MICTKCKIDKSEDQYYTYWHSTQQSFRTRKICRDCISLQHKQYKERVKKDIISQPDPPELQPEPIEVDTIERWLEFDNGIEYQHTFKTDVYYLLKNMGWKYNYDLKFWWKPTYRSKEGEFLFSEPDYLYIKKKGIKPKKTEDILDRMVQLKNRGWSYQKIADEYNLDDNTVKKWIVERKLTLGI
jgi:transposase